MAQVFARYAKDILERQTYPEVRRSPNAPPEPPYDVSAWSLGMLMGVEHVVVKSPLPATRRLEKLGAAPAVAGKVEAAGQRFSFDYRGPDAALAINRLLADGAAVSIDTARDGGRQIGRVVVTGASRGSLEKVAADLGFTVRSGRRPRGGVAIRAPRIGMYTRGTAATWTKAGRAGCWSSTGSAHAPAQRRHPGRRARDKFDAIILPDQSRTRSSKATRRARPGPSIAAASATTAWRR